MLRSVVPFAKGLGINCRWYVIEGTDDFFSVTKKFHNFLQGQKDASLSMKDLFYHYFETVQQNFKNNKVLAHMAVVHDPQPAAAIMSGSIFGHILWRCHIDTTEASRRVWRFLLPYLNQYHGAIFTDPDFVNAGLQIPIYTVAPSIDPLKPKNRQVTDKEAAKILEPLFNKYNIDGKRPIVLAVSRYDIHKNQHTIVKAFKMMKESPGVKKLNPQLIIVGNSASDDPEGQAMYDVILKEINNDADIYPLLNIENNDQNIGALMKLARCFVHVSTKEGFGLVVTEAMWHSTPVIGSAIGGIRQQVLDSNTGYLVEPHETEKIARHMQSLLENKESVDTLGANAADHVRKNFLLPSLIKKYLILMRYYLEVDIKFPEFRINDITYTEIQKAVFGRSIWPFTTDDLKDKVGKLWEELETQGPNSM